MQKVIWKDIPGYEGIYKVSTEGKVKSFLVDKRGRPMCSKVGSHGYKVVNLWKDKKGKSFLVHRLVGQSFLEMDDGDTVINHKDNIRTNNNVSNLEWCTQKENLAHAEAIGVCDFSRMPVAQYSLKGKLMATWRSATEASKSFEPLLDTRHRNSKISSCAKGNRKTAYGYRWKYLTEFSKNTGIVQPIYDWRIGQTVGNFIRFVKEKTGNDDIFYLNNEEMSSLYAEFLLTLRYA